MPEKLVRDRIPTIIEMTGAVPIIRKASDREFPVFTRLKLTEEVGEFLASGDPAELVDILEGLYTLAAEFGLTPGDLEILRARKAAERGGYKARIIWSGNLHNTSS